MHPSQHNTYSRIKTHWAVLSVTLLLTLVLCSCDRTFAGTFFMLNFRDIVQYVGFVLLFGIVAAVLSGANWRSGFWIAFLLGLVLTPIAGLIYCLILLTRR